MLSLYLGKHVEYLQGEQVIHIFKPALNETFIKFAQGEKFCK